MSTKKTTKAATPKEAVTDEQKLANMEKEANEESAKLQAEGDDTPSSESAPDNQTPSDEDESETEGTDDSDAGHETPDSGDQPSDDDTPDDEGDIKNLSPKAQKRFKKLSAKAKRVDDLEEEVKDLKKKSKPPQVPETPKLALTDPKPDPKTGKFPWEPKDEATNGETVLTEEQLDKKIHQVVAKTGDAEKLVEGFSSDIKSVEKKYPMLKDGEKDKKTGKFISNPDFDKELAEKISGWYENIAMRRTPQGGLIFKPNAPTFGEFVDSVMSIQSKAEESGKKKVTAKVLKRKAAQPISSTGGSPSGKGGLDKLKSAMPKTEADLDALEKEANKQAKKG